VAYRAAEAEESSAGRYREMGRWGDKEEIETAKRNIFFYSVTGNLSSTLQGS
jgi:hypothetical protein